MRNDFTSFISKSFQIWNQFFPLLFLKDSKNLRSLDIGSREMGAKNVSTGNNYFTRKQGQKQKLEFSFDFNRYG